MTTTRGPAWGRSVVVGAVLVAVLTACQPHADEYTFRNETEHDLWFDRTAIPAGTTVTVSVDRDPCLDGILLTSDTGELLAAVDRRVCDGGTVVLRPKHLVVDEATAAIVNDTDVDMKVTLPLGVHEEVPPGGTVELHLYRPSGGCAGPPVEVELGPEGWSARPPTRWCDGDTWVVEPEDLWTALGAPVHPGEASVVNERPDATVRVEVEGWTVVLDPGQVADIQPDELQANGCTATSLELKEEPRFAPPYAGVALRAEAVELCDGDTLRLTADGGAALVHADGTAAAVITLAQTTASIEVTNSTEVVIEVGLSRGRSMAVGPAGTGALSLEVAPGACADVLLEAEIPRQLPLRTDPLELCDGDAAVVTREGIAVVGPSGSQAPHPPAKVTDR